MPLIHGFSQLQTKVLAILLSTFIAGLGIKYWRSNQPLPEVDPELEKKFVAIADSLNAIESFQQKLTTSKISADQNFKINVNTASNSELQMLPGIGPTLAERIVKHRDEYGEFTDVEQLSKVKGIGKKTLEKLSNLITFQ